LFDHIAKFDAESGEHAVSSEMKEYNARLNKMTVTEDDVAKMCPSRITAVLMHPSIPTGTNWLSWREIRKDMSVCGMLIT